MFGSSVSGGGAEFQAPLGARQLQARYPGLQVRVDSDSEVTIFGRPAYSAATVEKAAAGFLDECGSALGVGAPDLRIEWQAALGLGNATVFAYRQYADGLPIEQAFARIVVRNVPRSAVVYASGRLVNVAPGQLDRRRTEPSAAVAAIRVMPDYAGLVGWSRPELVVYAGESDGVRKSPDRAWKFTAHSNGTADFRAFTFFVSAVTGRLIFARNEVYNSAAEVFGRVTGLGSPGTSPDDVEHEPIEMAMPELTVNSASAATNTDSGGEYVLDNSATGQVEVTASLSGPWVAARNAQGPGLHLAQTVSPPGPAVFVFNVDPAEFGTSQVNAFIHGVRTHEFFKHRQPAFAGLDRLVVANVNEDGTCNAFFTPVGLSINFFKAGGGCVNTAYSSVVAHEYGHFIVNRLGLGQGAFGEGFGDSVAILSYDDPIMGRDFFGPETIVRDIAAADRQYPCSSEVHTCGQVLAGFWWDFKLGVQSTLGPEAGLEIARQLFTDWSLITVGGKLRNSANSRTAVEVLTADDDDGDLSNGAPHESEICAAFAAHNIACPGSCDMLNGVRASCRRGTITVGVSTDLPSGTMLTFTLDGDDSREVATNTLGRAAARWEVAGPGEHQVCIEDCVGSCRTVMCTP